MDDLNREMLVEDWKDAEDQESLRAMLSYAFEDETTVNELQGIWDADRSYAIERAKQLEAAGACDFIVGRKGAKSRVRWKVDPSMVARIGLEFSDPKPAQQIGTVIWDWDRLIGLAAKQSGVNADSIVIDVKVGPLKKNLARLHEIEEEDIDVRVGY